ncbi:MAG: terpene cyclase/mutase family protein [Candidatus Nealsonbacteria bacterium]|nr:terpene cyclase/mutase family protein [Candidatus Nealsonbacteria bacterium]
MAAPILLNESQKQARGVTVDSRGWKEGRKAVGAREEMDERAEEGAVAVAWQDFLREHASWSVSAAVHALILVALGFWMLQNQGPEILLVSSPMEEEPLEDFNELKFDRKEEPRGGDIVDRVEPEPLEMMIDDLAAAEGIDAASVELSKIRNMDKAPYNDLLSEVGRGLGIANALGSGKGKKGSGFGLNGTGGGMGGRGGRRGNALGDGATKESEHAVDLALKWLADHQMPDGGWSFHHHLAPTCQGKCPGGGSMPEARIAATALGILPFLGAGQTHQMGKYQATVGNGLNFLIRNMRVSPAGGQLDEVGSGTMYSHGLAAIALCEAYGMQADMDLMRKKKLRDYDGTGDPGDKKTAPEKKQKPVPVPNLGRSAQAALNFIASAQDPMGGGWRYSPRTPGDTSVVGWQLMALLSGRMAYLRVSPACFLGAMNFLNSVQTDDYGSDYGYTDKDRPSLATQAIGLLSRMYLGWKPDHPGIVQGVQDMSGKGPSTAGNMYYNYYATQVMHHYGGEHWKQWNPRMRDWLVGSQSQVGHTVGSWHFRGGDRGADKGGRLYCTALAAMTLEVYYRHMPLYRKDALEHAGEGKKPKPEDQPADVF